VSKFIRESCRAVLWCAPLLFCAFFTACALIPKIPIVSDPELDAMVERDAQAIVAVADRPGARTYHFALAQFPRRDLLGLSLGQGRIYISYELTRLAKSSAYYRWMLRQTLAHEIAHEVAEHANHSGAVASQVAPESEITGSDLGLSMHVRFQNYSVDKELEADREGMKYWARLHWDCGIWTEILRNFQRQQYAGDRYHPTDRRVEEAVQACAAEPPPDDASATR